MLACARAASKRVCSALGRVKTVPEAGDELPEGTCCKHPPSSSSGLTTNMALEKSWKCPWTGCNVIVADKKNKSRHLDTVHGQTRRPRGRPRKTIACRTETDYQTDDSQRASHDQPCELQPHSHQTLPVRHPLNEWYIHQPWYQEIHGKQYQRCQQTR